MGGRPPRRAGATSSWADRASPASLALPAPPDTRAPGGCRRWLVGCIEDDRAAWDRPPAADLRLPQLDLGDQAAPELASPPLTARSGGSNPPVRTLETARPGAGGL